MQKRYGCHAMMLETVAAVPGMVGGMLLHLKSLRKFQHSGGWVKALLEEAENERMHLMTMIELVQPKWHERLLVLTVQGVFFNAFFVLYVLSPKLAHRFVGYLEEEAVYSYTEHLNAVESGEVENVPAPAIAIDYWRLPKDATLKDVLTVIRADEAHHRDVNHFASVRIALLLPYSFFFLWYKSQFSCMSHFFFGANFILILSIRVNFINEIVNSSSHHVLYFLYAGYPISGKGIERGSCSNWLSLTLYVGSRRLFEILCKT